MTTIRMIAFAACAGFALSGCAGGMSSSNASPEQVAAAAFVSTSSPSLTLYTMINNDSGAGAHTALHINASQSVIFDPAGSVRLTTVPEVDDVLYGVTPVVQDFYERAHARETYHVRAQTIIVTPEVAEQALRLAQANGAVSPALCTKATSTLLSKLPGFQSIDSTWLPKNLSSQLAQLPNVTTRVVREDDADDKDLAIDAFDQERREQADAQ